MRLSEAIRLGAMLKPQAFGSYWRDGATCAMGAAVEAAGGVNDDWPVQALTPATCPQCSFVMHNGCDGKIKATGAMIVHLNDEHRWTRERIADWVETVEQRSGDTRALVAVGLSDDATQLVNAR